MAKSKMTSTFIKPMLKLSSDEEVDRHSFSQSKKGFDDLEAKDVRTLKKNRLDPLTQKLNESGFLHKMRWNWFTFEYCGRKHPLEVSRYYLKSNMAVDINLTDRAMIEYKSNLLKSNGIKYAVLEKMEDYENILECVL